jgi:hypothetical protein
VERAAHQDALDFVREPERREGGVAQGHGGARDLVEHVVQAERRRHRAVDVVQLLEPLHLAAGRIVQPRVLDRDRGEGGEGRPEKVDLERREGVGLPRQEAQRTERAVPPGEPDAGQRADPLIAHPRGVREPFLPGQDRNDHGLRAPHDRPQEALAHRHRPEYLDTRPAGPGSDLGGEPDLALVLAGEPHVDQRARHERRRGAGHAVQDLGEAGPCTRRLGQLDQCPLGGLSARRRHVVLHGRNCSPRPIDRPDDFRDASEQRVEAPPGDSSRAASEARGARAR